MDKVVNKANNAQQEQNRLKQAKEKEAQKEARDVKANVQAKKRTMKERLEKNVLEDLVFEVKVSTTTSGVAVITVHLSQTNSQVPHALYAQTNSQVPHALYAPIVAGG